MRDPQKKTASLGNAEKQLVRELADEIITAGTHDLLFAIEEESDTQGAIKVLVYCEEVTKDSYGMHGDIFGDTGWIVRFMVGFRKSENVRGRKSEASTYRLQTRIWKNAFNGRV